MVSIGILLSTVVRRLLDFSSANTKRINKNVGVVLILFYEVKYHVQTVLGMPPRHPKVILQVPVAPKPSKIIKILMNAMDFQMNPNETSVKHSLMGFWNANVLTPVPIGCIIESLGHQLENVHYPLGEHR